MNEVVYKYRKGTDTKVVISFTHFFMELVRDYFPHASRGISKSNV